MGLINGLKIPKKKLKCRGTCIVLITNFLKYHGFISCFKKYSDKFDRDNVSNIEYSYLPRNIEVFLKNKKDTRDMYAIFNLLVSKN